MNRLIEILFWTVLLLAIVGLMCAWLAVKAVGADFGKSDLVANPPLFPADKAPTHLAAPVEFPGLMPPVVTVAHPAALVVPPVPLYRLYLSWQGSGVTGTTYRVRELVFTNAAARPTNAWAWPVRLATNDATSVIFSNDWKPGHGAFWVVFASNANSRTEIPIKSQAMP